MQRQRPQQEERKFDLSKEGFLKAWSLEELGGFGQDLALARTPTDILKRFSDSGEVGGKQKNQKPKTKTNNNIYIWGGGRRENGGRGSKIGRKIGRASCRERV